MDCEEWVFTQPAAGQTAYYHSHRKGKLRKFENRALMRTFGTAREKVTGRCRKLHNEEYRKLYVLFTKYISG
jgi:hypothetical protein